MCCFFTAIELNFLGLVKWFGCPIDVFIEWLCLHMVIAEFIIYASNIGFPLILLIFMLHVYFFFVSSFLLIEN